MIELEIFDSFSNMGQLGALLLLVYRVGRFESDLKVVSDKLNLILSKGDHIQ